MKFSVLIPVYNVEPYLRRCVESVLSQSVDVYEIILVNDGSTDDSGAICDYYKENHPDRVVVIHKKNQGLVSARRVGVTHARGEYVCFLDSDDFWEPHLLSTLEQLLSESKADVVCFGYTLVDENDTELRIGYPLLSEGVYQEEAKQKILEELLSGTSLNNLWLKCVRLSCIDKDRDYSPFFSVSSGEDLLQTLPIFDNASSIQIVHDRLYNYYQNSQSITQSKYLEKHLSSTFLVYRELGIYVEKWRLSTQAYYDKMGQTILFSLKQLIRRRVGKGAYSVSEREALLDRLQQPDIRDVVEHYSPRKNPVALQMCYHCFAKNRFRSLDMFLILFGNIYQLGKRR